MMTMIQFVVNNNNNNNNNNSTSIQLDQILKDRIEKIEISIIIYF